MSMDQGSIGSSSTGAAPPPAAPAAAPPSAAPPPAAAPVAPPTPAAASPAAPPPAAAAPPLPGALPSQPGPPATLDDVKARYRQQLESLQQEGAQPEAVAPAVEAQPEAIQPPVEAQPEAPEPTIVEPPTEPAVEASTATVEPVDEPDLDTILTLEDLERLNPRVPKKALAEFAKRESHRGELQKSLNTIGGEPGVKLAEVLNPIIWAECPFDETSQPAQAEAWWGEKVNAFFDQIVLQEHAGATKLFDHMGKHLIQTQMQDPATGPAFASNMITEEWGTNDDGTPFDFWGMEPLQCVDLLIRAAKHKDGEGESLINKEFLERELGGKAKPAEPTARELALQKENEELRAGKQATEAEQTRKSEQQTAQYMTQAKGYVTRTLMSEVMPLATKANWAATPGEEGPQVEQKKILGRLITADINSHIMGAPDALTPEYSEVLSMIKDGTAFDAAGHPTQRFGVKLKPLQIMAKARFNEIQRVLNSQFKFAAQTSRAAQLVKKTGGNIGTPTSDNPPPLAVTPPARDPNKPMTTEERLAAVRAPYREAKRVYEEQQRVGVR